MHMKDYEELKDKLCEELEEIARKPEMSAGDLEAVHKLTDTIKNIDKIAMLEDDDGYSNDGDWEARGRYAHMYDEGGSSYARGRKRDSMGRYSRDGRDYSRRGGRGYSRDDAKGDMIDKLEDMKEDAKSERARETIDRCIATLKGM